MRSAWSSTRAADRVSRVLDAPLVERQAVECREGPLGGADEALDGHGPLVVREGLVQRASRIVRGDEPFGDRAEVGGLPRDERAVDDAPWPGTTRSSECITATRPSSTPGHSSG